MKKIKNIVDTAPTKELAYKALEALRIVGNITDEEYKKGKRMIKKEFE